MGDFSIEMEAERIYDSRVRDYFQEVLTSYINKNYRSAVVMLWTVVICDLVYKLKALRDQYADNSARDILNNLEKLQSQNPNSPEWELTLLEEIEKRTQLLDVGEYKQMVYLQQERHLSAHPVLKNADLLHNPSAETVRALIRNALEAVLLKPPLLTQKIETRLVVDMAEKKATLIDDRSLERYLDAAYLRNLRPDIENHLFRTVWKFAFSLGNSDTDANRDINIRVLHILYRRRPSEINTYIEADSGFFSRVDISLIEHLIKFLQVHPKIYPCLADDLHVVIENCVKKRLDLRIQAHFLAVDINSHMQSIWKALETHYDTSLDEETFQYIIDLSTELGQKDKLFHVAIEFYSKSWSYDAANQRFELLIEPFISEFDTTLIEKLLNGIEQNNQTYNRNRSRRDHTLLYNHCLELGFKISRTRFQNFYRDMYASLDDLSGFTD